MTPPLLRSAVLNDITGISHGFTDRRDGFSAGHFAQLNLSTRVGDDRPTVEKNREEAVRRLGVPGRQLVTLKQVHGDGIVQVKEGASRAIEADGLWTRDRAACIGVLVADCVPILIAHRSGELVAAVHAGWRGTAAHIAAQLVKRLVRAGMAAEDLRAALGPAIGPCCFTVDGDTSASLLQAYPSCQEVFSPRPEGKAMVDLWRLNHEDLREAGLQPRFIDILESCTACDERFFSHRRDQGTTGRQGALIALL